MPKNNNNKTNENSSEPVKIDPVQMRANSGKRLDLKPKSSQSSIIKLTDSEERYNKHLKLNGRKKR